MSGSRERRMMTVVRPAPEGGLQPEQAVRGLCREALQLRSALDMECWISSLLGQIWEQRRAAPPVDDLDPTFALGASLMEQIAQYGGPGARLTLHAVACVYGGGLGVRCGQLADELPRQRLPRWARERGPVAVRKAMTETAPGDGQLICLEASGGGRITHTVTVFVDLRQGGIAKHVHLLQPLAVWARDAFGPGGALATRGVTLAPARACERVLEAIRRTDEHEYPLLGDGFVELRALALARASAQAWPRSDAAWLN